VGASQNDKQGASLSDSTVASHNEVLNASLSDASLTSYSDVLNASLSDASLTSYSDNVSNVIIRRKATLLSIKNGVAKQTLQRII
jgi:hypothetical protein